MGDTEEEERAREGQRETDKQRERERESQRPRTGEEVEEGTDLDAGAVCEEGLGALGVVEGAVTHAAPRRPDGQLTTVKQVPRTVPVLSCLVHHLKRQTVWKGRGGGETGEENGGGRTGENRNKG